MQPVIPDAQPIHANLLAQHKILPEKPGEKDPLKKIPLPEFPKTKYIDKATREMILLESNPINAQIIDPAKKFLDNPDENPLSPSSQNLRFFIEKNVSTAVSEKLSATLSDLENVKASLMGTLHDKTSNLLQTLSKAKENPARDLFLKTNAVEKNYLIVEKYLESANVKINRSELTRDKIEEVLKDHPNAEIEAQLDELAQTLHFERLLQHLKKDVQYNENDLIKEIAEKIKESDPNLQNLDHNMIKVFFDWLHRGQNRGSIDQFLASRKIHIQDHVKTIVIQRFYDALVKEKINSLQKDIDESLSNEHLTNWIQGEVTKATNRLTYKIFDRLEKLSQQEYSQLFSEVLDLFNQQLKAEAEAKIAVEKVQKFYSKAIKVLQSNQQPKNEKEIKAKEKYLQFLAKFLKPEFQNKPLNELTEQDISPEKLNFFFDDIHFQAMLSALKSIGAGEAIDLLTKKFLRLIDPENKGIREVLQETLSLPPKLQNLSQSISFLKENIYSQEISFIQEGGTLLKLLSDSLLGMFIENSLHEQVKGIVENISKPENIISFCNTTIMPAVNSSLIGNLAKHVIAHNLPKVASWLNTPGENLQTVSQHLYALLKEEAEVEGLENYVDQDQFRHIIQPFYQKLLKAKELSSQAGGFNFDHFKEIANLSFFPPVNPPNNPILGQILVNLTQLTDLPPLLKWLVNNSTLNQLLSHQLSHALHDYSSNFYAIFNSTVESFKAKEEISALTLRLQNYEAIEKKINTLKDSLKAENGASQKISENIAREEILLASLKEQYENDIKRLKELAPLYETAPQLYTKLNSQDRAAIEARILTNEATPEEIQQLKKYKEFEATKTAKLAQSTLGYITSKKIPFGRKIINKIFGEGAQVAIKAIQQVGQFFKSKARNKAIAIEVGNIAFRALDSASSISAAPATPLKVNWKGLSLRKTMNKVERIVLAIFTFGMSELVIWLINLNKSSFKFGKEENEIFNFIENVTQQKQIFAQTQRRLESDLEAERRGVSYHQSQTRVKTHTEIQSISPSIIKAQKILKDFLLEKTDKVYASHINHYFTVMQDSLKFINRFVPGLNNFVEMVNSLIDGDNADSIPSNPGQIHAGPIKTIIEQSSLLISDEIFNRIVSILTSVNDAKWKNSMDELPHLLNDHISSAKPKSNSSPTAREYDLSKRLIQLIFPGTEKNPKSSYELLFNKIFEQPELILAYDAFYEEINKLIAEFKKDSFKFTQEQAENIKELIKIVVVHSVQKNIEKALFKKIQSLVELISKKETWENLFEDKIYPAAIQQLIIQKCAKHSAEFNQKFDEWLSNPDTFYREASDFFYKIISNGKDLPGLKSLILGNSPDLGLNESIELKEPSEQSSPFDYELTKAVIVDLLKRRIAGIYNISDIWKFDKKNEAELIRNPLVLFDSASNFILTRCYPNTNNNSKDAQIQMLNHLLGPSYKRIFESVLLIKESPSRYDEIQELVEAEFNTNEGKPEKEIEVSAYPVLIKNIVNAIQSRSSSKMLWLANKSLGLVDKVGGLNSIARSIGELLDPINQSPDWLIDLLSEKLTFFLEEETKSSLDRGNGNLPNRLPNNNLSPLNSDLEKNESSHEVDEIASNTNVKKDSSQRASTASDLTASLDSKHESNQLLFSHLLFNQLTTDTTRPVKLAVKAILGNAEKTEEYLNVSKDLLFGNEEKLQDTLLTFFESLINVLELDPEKQRTFATKSIRIKDFDEQPVNQASNNNNTNENINV